MDRQQWQARLATFGQDHLLDFADELSQEQWQQLEKQLADIDFAQLEKLSQAKQEMVDWAAIAARAEPPQAVELGQAHPELTREAAREAGESALRGGRLAVIIVAGGQGTRLGFDQPKGLFPIGPLSQRTLFQMHCDRLRAVMERYGVSIPLYVMTSPATDAATREYFADNDRCGLAADQLRIFCQGTMPAVDATTGKVLLSAKDSVALSPDGHGGVVAALAKNGCLAEAAAAGIEQFFYAQVDNPLAELCDPELIGYHLLARSQLTTQVVRKRFPQEKVGNVVTVDGKTQIIEYSDLPEAVAERKNADGTLKLWAGNIAIHVIDRSFLESVVDDVDGLPFHRAHKKVPFIDSAGESVAPESPNATKFERFVFDLLPLAAHAFVVEGDAARIFAPVKNADGAEFDTPSTSRQALLDLHRQWLQAAGAQVDEGVRVEIHPRWALDAEQAAAKVADGTHFSVDTYLT